MLLIIVSAAIAVVVLGLGGIGRRTRRRDALRAVILVVLVTVAVLLPYSTADAQAPPPAAATSQSGDLNGACPPELGGLNFRPTIGENKVQENGAESYKYWFECAYWNAPEEPLKKAYVFVRWNPPDPITGERMSWDLGCHGNLDDYSRKAVLDRDIYEGNIDSERYTAEAYWVVGGKRRAATEALAKSLLERVGPPAPGLCADAEEECEVAPIGIGIPESITSIPKDLADYNVQAQIPEFIPQRPNAPSYEEMRDSRTGELEILFCYRDRRGVLHEQSFREPFSALNPASDGDRDRRELLDGEMTVAVAGRSLALRYRVLDELEVITRNPDNGHQRITSEEEIFRGSRLTFSWQIKLYDDEGIVAQSVVTQETSLNYVIRYPIVFLPGTGGSQLAVDDEIVWPANLQWGGTFEHSRNYWQSLMLDEAGNGQNVTAPDVFRSYAWGYKSVYQGFLDHLAGEPLNYEETEDLLLFPYDWRLETDRHVARLDGASRQQYPLQNRLRQPH